MWRLTVTRSCPRSGWRGGQAGPADGATLDELLERIKAELVTLGPILEMEVVREPEGSRTEAAWPRRITTIERRASSLALETTEPRSELCCHYGGPGAFGVEDLLPVPTLAVTHGRRPEGRAAGISNS